ncbi:hypothetical protein, partial [Pyramidobacter sp. CG50-2]|uniref:hypothetical protein n=1 Tax=Pyramidobacter sp. CG50-2 TaxID=2382160 RepID=UPI000EC7C01B
KNDMARNTVHRPVGIFVDAARQRHYKRRTKKETLYAPDIFHADFQFNVLTESRHERCGKMFCSNDAYF